MTIDRRSFLTAGAGISLSAAMSGGLVGCATPAVTEGASGHASGPVMDEQTKATIDRIVDEQLKATGLAGLAGVVRIRDGIWRGSVGVSDLTTTKPFRAGDFVRIASISKTYTATAVLQLVDEGKVALDDKLEKYVPGVINGTEATIENLLGMSSGIPDFTANEGFLRRFTADPTLRWSDADTLAVIAESKRPDFAPGEKVVYCDSNYALLGMIIAKVTGSPAGEVITSKIIEPLELTSTSYPTQVSIPDPHPTSYVPVVSDPSMPFDNAARPPRVVNDVNPAVPSTAGAMISTLDDLQKWGTELVTGSLLTGSLQARRLRTRRFDGQKINFGYGLGITNLNQFLGHDGAIFGYSTVVLTRPETDTQIAFVSNESTNFTTPTLSVAVAIIKELYPDQLQA